MIKFTYFAYEFFTKYTYHQIRRPQLSRNVNLTQNR